LSPECHNCFLKRYSG